jgi:RHS repeat-associated protein
VITDNAGTVVSTHDYYPFGESMKGFASFNTHQFTGHERDLESGLDYMLARYYSTTAGRFQSVDPSRRSVLSAAPQTWNRYAYVLNNPVSRVDPDGEVSYLVSRPTMFFQRHMFIVTGAAFPGDTGPSVHYYSYGKSSAPGSKGKVGRVDDKTTGFSKGTSATDQSAWKSLSNAEASKKVDFTVIPAKDGKVESVAGALKETKDYRPAAGPNSNSAAQAVADTSAGMPVAPPAPEHLSVNPVNPTAPGDTAEIPGAEDAEEMEFDDEQIKKDAVAGKHDQHVPPRKP